MLSEISGLAIPARNRSYRPTVIPAKAGIYRQHEAWIPAFAGTTFGLFYAVLQHERFRLCRVRSAKQNVGIYQGANPNITMRVFPDVGVCTPTYEANSARQLTRPDLRTISIASSNDCS
jgi:hypothetical protein